MPGEQLQPPAIDVVEVATDGFADEDTDQGAANGRDRSAVAFADGRSHDAAYRSTEDCADRFPVAASSFEVHGSSARGRWDDDDPFADYGSFTTRPVLLLFSVTVGGRPGRRARIGRSRTQREDSAAAREEAPEHSVH